MPTQKVGKKVDAGKGKRAGKTVRKAPRSELEKKKKVVLNPRRSAATAVLKQRLHNFLKSASQKVAAARTDPAHPLTVLRKTASPKVMNILKSVDSYTTGTQEHQEQLVEEMAHKLVSEPVPEHAQKERNRVLDVLVDKEMREKTDEKWLAAALMDGFRYENLGWPDQFNAAPCGRPKILTHVTIPFDSNGEARVLVSDDPKSHIIVLGGGSSKTLSTSTYTNLGATGVSVQWNISSLPSLKETRDGAPKPVLCKDGKVVAEPPKVDDSAVPDASPVAVYVTPSFATAGGASIFFFKNGSIWDPYAPTEDIPIDVFDISGTRYEGIRCAAGDSLSIAATCPDTTANNILFNAFFILSDNTTTVGTQATRTGDGVLAGATITAPANTVAVYGYSITNGGTGFTGSKIQAFTTVTIAASNVTYPMGASDGTDVTFIDDYADEFRTTSMSVWTEYFGSQLSNGILVQGQFPDGTGRDMPPASLQNWARIPGFVNKALGGEDPGAFTWCFPHSLDTLKFHTLEEETGSFERVGVFIKANDTDAQNVQLHTAVDFSVRSNNQFYPQEPGITDEEAIEELLAVLSLFPNTTSNADHESTVDELIRTVSSVANTFSFLNGNTMNLTLI
jgi:hypothetical protein